MGHQLREEHFCCRNRLAPALPSSHSFVCVTIQHPIPAEHEEQSSHPTEPLPDAAAGEPIHEARQGEPQSSEEAQDIVRQPLPRNECNAVDDVVVPDERAEGGVRRGPDTIERLQQTRSGIDQRF